MKKYAVMVAAAAVLLAAGTVRAQEEQGKKHRGPGDRPRPGEMIKEMDADKDGKVTFEEFKAFHDKHMKERFDRLDTNGDGVLSPDDRPKGPPPPAKGECKDEQKTEAPAPKTE
jgi:hypothetical protein